jgi:hypothetical protein
LIWMRPFVADTILSPQQRLEDFTSEVNLSSLCCLVCLNFLSSLGLESFCGRCC